MPHFSPQSREYVASSVLSDLTGSSMAVTDVGIEILSRSDRHVGAFVAAPLLFDVCSVHHALSGDTDVVLPSELRATSPHGQSLVWSIEPSVPVTVDSAATFLQGWRDQVWNHPGAVQVPQWDPIQLPLHWLTLSRPWCSARVTYEIQIALRSMYAIADGIAQHFDHVLTYNQVTAPGGLVTNRDRVCAGYRWTLLARAPFEWELAGLVGYGQRVLKDEFFMQRVAQRLGVVTDWAAVSYLASLRDLWEMAALSTCEGSNEVQERMTYLRMITFAAAGIDTLS